jgi:hypothetical protein
MGGFAACCSVCSGFFLFLVHVALIMCLGVGSVDMSPCVVHMPKCSLCTGLYLGEFPSVTSIFRLRSVEWLIVTSVHWNCILVCI